MMVRDETPPIGAVRSANKVKAVAIFDNAPCFVTSRNGQTFLIPQEDALELKIGDYVQVNGRNREVVKIFMAEQIDGTEQMGAIEVPGSYTEKTCKAGFCMKDPDGKHFMITELKDD